MGADGTDDGIDRDLGLGGPLDELIKGGEDIFTADLVQTGGAGVAVDGARVGELVLVRYAPDFAPVEEIFLDGLAVRVMADGTFASVAVEMFGGLEFAWFLFHIVSSPNRNRPAPAGREYAGLLANAMP
jgi:hypothetical protein